MPFREVVEHGHGVAGVDERPDGVTADIARPATDEDPRHPHLPIE
jgi:hypothetical protein